MRHQKRKRMIAWILLLAVLTVNIIASPVNMVGVQAADTLPKSDEFTGDALDSATWAVHSKNDANLSVKDGALVIKSEAGTVEGTKDTAKNIVYQPVSGNWESVTHVKTAGDFNADYQQVGVMVTGVKDDKPDFDNYVYFRYEYNHYFENQYGIRKGIHLKKEIDGSVKTEDEKILDYALSNNTEKDLYFKVKKLGTNYSFAISKDGQTYTDVGNVTFGADTAIFALTAYNDGAEAGAIEAKYQSVTFTEANLESVEREPLPINTGVANTLYLGEQYTQMSNMEVMPAGYEGSAKNETGHAVLGNIENGSYATYPINVTTAGTYKVAPYFARRNYDNINAKINVYVDEDLKSTWEIGDVKTDSMFDFDKLESHSIDFTEGAHTIKVEVIYEEVGTSATQNKDKKINLGWIRISDQAEPVEIKSGKNTLYLGEQYTQMSNMEVMPAGYEGSATNNTGHAVLGNIENNGYATYPIKVTEAGTYKVVPYFARQKFDNINAIVKITVDGDTTGKSWKIGDVQTESMFAFEALEAQDVVLAAGEHTLKVEVSYEVLPECTLTDEDKKQKKINLGWLDISVNTEPIEIKAGENTLYLGEQFTERSGMDVMPAEFVGSATNNTGHAVLGNILNGGYTVYPVKVTAAGSYEVIPYYARRNYDNIEATVSISVDDTLAGSWKIGDVQTESMFDFEALEAQKITLGAGEHTVKVAVTYEEVDTGTTNNKEKKINLGWLTINQSTDVEAIQEQKGRFTTAETAKNAVNRTLYTDASLAAMDAAYTAAKTEYDKDMEADPDVLKGLIDELNAKITALEEKTVTVTFDAAGGTTVEKQTIKVGAKATEPNAPKKIGYTFSGWYANGAKFNFATAVTADITLKANWTKNKTLADAQNAFQAITLPAEVNKGKYTESSWNTMQDAYAKAKAEYGNGDAADPAKLQSLVVACEAAVKNLMTIEVEAARNNFSTVKNKKDTIDKDLHDAAELKKVEDAYTPVAEEYNKGAAADAATLNSLLTGLDQAVSSLLQKEVQIVQEGFKAQENYMSSLVETRYTEDSWGKVKQAYDAAKAEADKGNAVTVSTLKALTGALATAIDELVLKDFVVKFTVDGTELPSQVVKAGEKMVAPATPEKAGHTFIGWYAGEEKMDIAAPVESDMTLVAKWEEEAGLKTEKETFQQAESKKAELKQEEYDEESWKEVEEAYNAAKAEYDKGFNADSAKLKELNEKLDKAIQNLKKITYEVTFDTAGGSEIESVKVEIGEKVTQPEAPVREGYQFLDWYVGEEVYDFTKAVEGDITLTAKWEETEELKSSKDQYQNVVNTIAGLDRNLYTEESWKQVEAAYNAAKAELEKGDAMNVVEFQKLTITLKEVFQKLVLKPATVPNTNVVVDTGIKVEGIQIDGISKQIAAGKKIKLSAEISPVNATNREIKWSSDNTGYATVDANGVVTTTKAGKNKTVTIKATAADGSGVFAEYKIKIMPKAVKKIKLTTGSTTVTAGKKVTIKAAITPKASKKMMNSKLQWISSSTRYATVNSKGIVTTKKAGKGKTVKITAKATDGSNKKAIIKLKLK